ncbi:MAG TPA: hypothetical protein VHG51_13665 [Longimicrobiaceae bacterium]|nr:hypothetical protein [Longimicrobiaceae bacterium]
MVPTLRGLALVLAAIALTACDTLVEVDSRAEGVRIALEREAYAPGDTLSARLVNDSGVELGYNFCITTLLRREGGGWVVADVPLALCTAELRPLRPGDSVALLREIPARLESGEYRLRATVLVPLDGGGRAVVDSGSFRVQQ